MKMDGTSKRKLSKRKDPELALTYYKAEGYPIEAVYEYILTILNSNYEDWRRANPTTPATEFKFSYKKMNPAGSLFDVAKLRDVSKNVISVMDAETVYKYVAAWALEFDPEFAKVFTADPAFSTAILAIGRGGKKPRKDIAVWSEVKDYAGFFFDEYFKVTEAYPETFDKADIKAALLAFKESFDASYDSGVWFDKIKAIADTLGFASDMKAYKADPTAFRGSVADISMFLRVAVTGRLNSPDMYSVMQLLGRERVFARIDAICETL